MAGNLVSIGSFTNTTEAAFVVNRLRQAGFGAVMADDYIVTADFLLGNAIGWIKVQVPDDQFEGAMDLLETKEPPVPVDEIPWDAPDEESGAFTPEENARIEAEKQKPPDQEIPESEAEKLIHRAYRTSIAGLFLLPPLPHFFALYLLLRASFLQNEYPSSRTNIHYYAALLISVSVISIAWYWYYLITNLVSLLDIWRG